MAELRDSRFGAGYSSCNLSAVSEYCIGRDMRFNEWFVQQQTLVPGREKKSFAGLMNWWLKEGHVSDKDRFLEKSEKGFTLYHLTGPTAVVQEAAARAESARAAAEADAARREEVDGTERADSPLHDADSAARAHSPLHNDEDLEDAPPLIVLSDNEKFRDAEGRILDVEMRGARSADGLFFYARDVAVKMLQQLPTRLTDKFGGCRQAGKGEDHQYFKRNRHRALFLRRSCTKWLWC
ncbi:hypothetical protein HDU88_003444 [Geranomyces variabilis]|nr:hypothetical protein HDU88_003444 [Geranomyces variabilis]